MTTLWTFGDSYAHIFKPDNDQYLNQVANKLNLEHKYYGKNGCSIPYTSYTFNQVRNSIDYHDVVIVALTGPSRRWFRIKDDMPTPEQKEAEQQYREHLIHEPEDTNIALDFLYNLHYLTEKKILHTIILPCFEPSLKVMEKHKNEFPLFTVPNGTLYNEISHNELTHKFYKRWASYDGLLGNKDPRLNHMVRYNHNILADKIVDYIEKKTEINLKTGFMRNIIDFNMDEQQRRYELFNNKNWFF